MLTRYGSFAVPLPEGAIPFLMVMVILSLPVYVIPEDELAETVAVVSKIVVVVCVQV